MLTFLEQARFFVWELFKFMTLFYVVWAPGFLISGLITSRYRQSASNSVVGRSKVGFKGVIQAIVLGIVGSSGRKASINATLDLFKEGVPPSRAFVFLIASRNMTIHFWSIFALSLGAEFATGQALGALVMVLVVSPAIHWLAPSAVTASTVQTSEAGSPSIERYRPLSWHTLLISPAGWRAVIRVVWREFSGFAASLAVGIVIGGVIFAAGLQPWWPRFADIFGHATFLSDLANVFVGAALSFVLSLSPVGNIPVVHALFKTDGLGYPGIISFCLASVIHRKDIKAYASAFKQVKTVWLLAGLLYAGAVLGGLGSTWIYSAFGFRPSLPPVKLAGRLLDVFLNYLKQ